MSTRANLSARIMLVTLAAIGAAAGLTSCGDDDSTSSTQDAAPVVDPGDGGVYAPVIDPANFVDRIDNPYLPFLPGSRWVLVGESDGETERVEVTVLEERKLVMGISTVDGAVPGIVMPAQPSAGAAFRQEYYEGKAEDMFEILSVTESRTVPAGVFDAVVETEDWSPLEPDTIEHKYDAPGVGLVGEEKVAGGEGVLGLVEFTPGA